MTTTETKHTLGPWTVNTDTDQRHHSFGIMAEAARPAHPLIADVRFGLGHVDSETAKANARLISALPEAFYALQLFMEQYGTGIGDERSTRPEVMAAMAALKKAGIA